jgi:hypothetical protein
VASPWRWTGLELPAHRAEERDMGALPALHFALVSFLLLTSKKCWIVQPYER